MTEKVPEGIKEHLTRNMFLRRVEEMEIINIKNAEKLEKTCVKWTANRGRASEKTAREYDFKNENEDLRRRRRHSKQTQEREEIDFSRR